MQDIGGALDHLDMAEVADREIITKLTEAVKSFTQNHVPLTAQLKNAINLNLEMAKELDIKPKQEPEEKIIIEKSKRKAEFEKNTDPEGYF